MIATKPFLVYAQRPADGTSLWLPSTLAKILGIIQLEGHAVSYPRGKQLTPAQYADARVQDLIARRAAAKSNTPVE